MIQAIPYYKEHGVIPSLRHIFGKVVGANRMKFKIRADSGKKVSGVYLKFGTLTGLFCWGGDQPGRIVQIKEQGSCMWIVVEVRTALALLVPFPDIRVCYTQK